MPSDKEKVESVELEEAEDGLEEMPGGIVLKRRGRPIWKYNPQYAVIAGAMLSKGATIAELAAAFGVSNNTIWKWRQTHEDFDRAFGELGSAFDDRIERTLAERAMGYTYESVKVFNHKGIPVIVPVLEHCPPELAAIKMWLSARRPEKWRIKDEIEISGDEAFRDVWKNMKAKKEEEK